MAPQLYCCIIAETDPEAARAIKRAASELWSTIFEAYRTVPATGPLSRQRAIARTKLEEAVMWSTNLPRA